MAILSEHLKNFAASVAIATSAPDDYSEIWVDLCGNMEDAYRINREDVFADWAEVRAGLKRDVEKIAFIDERLRIAFEAFDRGDKKIGRDAVFEIYNLQIKKLR